MNPISTASWFWQAIRARSLTFAALFACSIWGISVVGWFRHVLRHWGAPWYAWLFLPFLAVGVLGRKEVDWFPDPEVRKKWSRWIILGSIFLVMLAAKLAPGHRN